MKSQTHNTPRLVLIGAGRMGGAFLQGWLQSQEAPREGSPHPYPPESWAILDPSPDRLEHRAQTKGALLAFPALSKEQAQNVEIVLLAVKPQKVQEAAEHMKDWLPETACLVSVVAGLSLKGLRTFFPSCSLVQAMPNTSVAIRQGVSVYVPEEGLSSTHEARVRSLFMATGMAERLEKESLFDAVTALSGCGPAYVYYLTEAMAAVGMREGLPQDVAERLARLAVIGAGALLETEQDKSPQDLRHAVASPGGATQAALDVLAQDDGLLLLMRKAMTRARERAHEMSIQALS